MERVLVSREQLKVLIQETWDMGLYGICGANSLTLRDDKVKYLDGSVCREWPNLDGEAVWMSPGEAARTEYRREFGSLRRRGRDIKRNGALFEVLWPIACLASYKGPAVYMDIKGAYYQIMRRLWWDGVFPRGAGTLDLMPPMDRLAGWKAARNAALGIVRPSQITIMSGGQLSYVRPKGPLENPSLWATVMAILHEVAWMAIEHGAIYIATDGYIFPSEAKWLAFYRQITLDYGLDLRVRLCPAAHIVSWGCYYLDAKKYTKRWAEKRGYPSEIANVDTPHPRSRRYFLDWWRFTIDRIRNTEPEEYFVDEVLIAKQAGMENARDLQNFNSKQAAEVAAFMSGEILYKTDTMKGYSDV